MRKTDYVVPLLAGIGIGMAAGVLLAPQAGDKTRKRAQDTARRAGDVLKEHAENLSDTAGELLEMGKRTWRDTERESYQTMSDLRDKAKDKIDEAAVAAKKATDHVVDKTKDLAHKAGKKMEEAGKQLQDA